MHANPIQMTRLIFQIALESKTPWRRHLIKKSGATQHHDQAFGDFLGTRKAQLAFWNQGANWQTPRVDVWLQTP